ncbi:hypothetical protein [Flavobacterium sp.]|uniref:hypothetical protein n=1 Tax=Flavobacterium sp. TaxID=239 RepID=UPI0031DE4C3A
MRILVLSAIAVLTFSCSNKEKITIVSAESLQKPLQTKEKEIKIEELNQNTHYIGFVNKFYFSNKNEVYIELYLNKDDISKNEYNKLEKLSDSLIYSDDENARYKFPTNLAAKNFDLRGLGKLAIYDDHNEFVCNAGFVRVEYLNQSISPCFIAVYKTDKEIKTENYYGISNFEKNLETEQYSITKDTVLTQKLLTKLNVPKSYYGLKSSGIHILSSKNDTIISVINSEDSAYIISHNGDDFKVLYKSSESENINDLKVIPFKKNKLPYLLTKNSRPDTDISWDNLLYYDRTKYSNSTRQRIK